MTNSYRHYVPLLIVLVVAVIAIIFITDPTGEAGKQRQPADLLITLDEQIVEKDDFARLFFEVGNEGDTHAPDAEVLVYINGEEVLRESYTIRKRDEKKLFFDLSLPTYGGETIFVEAFVDAENSVRELDEGNNEAVQEYFINLPPPLSICTDSDGGLQSEVFGTVVVTSTRKDRRETKIFEDVCKGKSNLDEYSCDPITGEYLVSRLSCMDGCSEGTCIAEPYPVQSFYYHEKAFSYPPFLRVGSNSLGYYVFDQRPPVCNSGYCTYDASLCQQIDYVDVVLTDSKKKPVYQTTLHNDPSSCRFSGSVFIDQEFLEKELFVQLAPVDKTGKTEERDIGSSPVLPDISPPYPIKGIADVYTTYPINFYITLQDNYGVSDVSLRIKTNVRDYNIPLQKKLTVDEFSELFSAQWQPDDVFNEDIEEIELIASDVFANVRRERLEQEFHIIDNEVSCNKLLYNGPPSEKINTIFIPIKYTSGDFATADFTLYHKRLFEKDPFNKKQNQFNFFVLQSDLTLTDYNDYFSLIQNACGIDVEDAHQVYRLIKQGGRSNARQGNSIVYTSNPLNPPVNTFIHEWGHSFGTLTDEYWAMYDKTYRSFYPAKSTNDPWQINIDLPGCPKWCSGGLDKDSPYYSYYEGWKSCVAPYRNDPYSSGNDQRLRDCWNTWNDALLEEHSLSLQYIDLGEGCEEETDCIFTAHGVGKFRSTPLSIMYGAYSGGYGRYGIVSENYLSTLIDTYGQSEREVITNIPLDPTAALITFTTSEPSAYFSSPSLMYSELFDEDGQIVEGYVIDFVTMDSQRRIQIAEKILRDSLLKEGKVREAVSSSVSPEDIDLNVDGAELTDAYFAVGENS